MYDAFYSLILLNCVLASVIFHFFLLTPPFPLAASPSPQVSYVRNTKAQEEEELKRLREEVMMLERLSHPNIVRCLGATQHEGHINIFIEWMAGMYVCTEDHVILCASHVTWLS